MKLLNNLSLFGDIKVKNGLIMLQENWIELKGELMQKGYTQISTGNGKGKTTAALGLITRFDAKLR